MCAGSSPAAGQDAFNIITLRDHPVPYISMVDLAERFNIPLEYDPCVLTCTARCDTSRLVVTNRSSIAALNGVPVNLVFPAQIIQGAMFVPVRPFLPLFSRLLPGELAWDERTRTVDTSGIEPTITSFRVESREGGMLATIGMTRMLPYSDTYSDGRWLTIRFKGGYYDPEQLFGSVRPSGNELIQEIRHAQTGGETFISFLVSERMGTYSISRLENPPELLVSFRYTAEPPAAALGEPSRGIAEPAINTDLVVIDTVVIDAGHGGNDPGAVGPKGTREKDIVLAIANELKALADQRKEIKVVMTRDRDTFVSLRERARIAGEANGKLFISIHANANRNRNHHGMEAYFLSNAKTEDAKAVAERENAVVKFEDDPGEYSGDLSVLSKIQFDMLSSVYIDESQYLCQMLLDKGVSATKQVNRGVRQAPFYVLLGTQALMPSVLFEVGYISNANEETMLRRVSSQKRIAESIYDAVIEFKRRAERDLVTQGAER
jgi:N-acetylmuramoyl-L-alanine amidase